ncbi:hypothetical protein PP357_gp13 [Arthrobacter phage Sarge]|uniref:Uncharacterized protein n=2 Tax=Caudoviricetes TaxID=2731619 RepID=A0AAE9C1I0_9CAUD|nr:hypothetical protein PP357_gp13 [Arthrobacter phage Sarge]YP_010649632.1 hypothetical protein PP358_gp12 [Arthrobacter phage Shoya]QIG57683.1 hypothetical protein SEA_SHOYA_12 [Arthrobacter phage Shoya]UDL14860.1 hypothetical protein SEA_SARGE_13 [Arthrobacter phage Sarge]
MAEKQDVLVSPDGKREWTPEDATQATNLRAKGWTPKANKSAPKTTTK